MVTKQAVKILTIRRLEIGHAGNLLKHPRI